MPKSFDGSDIIHTEGFPEGWFVQERDEYEALLCRREPEPNIWGWPRCYCRKPRLAKMDEWLPIAQIIAAAIEQERGGMYGCSQK